MKNCGCRKKCFANLIFTLFLLCILETKYAAAQENVTSSTQTFPVSYDAREEKKTPVVRDQGEIGSCWAFACVSALEASLLPKEHMIFSADHMSRQNAYNRLQEEGGEPAMSMSYLLSWSGPVLEKDDPYGDNKSASWLSAKKHVQEIQFLPSKDMGKIKTAIMEYGAVQSSLYISLSKNRPASPFYNSKTSAYCYSGNEEVNHDIIIIGWDDEYSKENFLKQPNNDGAYLCQSSWGENFGDGGCFWVSYEDLHIGRTNIIYTKIEGTDNYDRIYQTDLCGFTGQLGFGTEYAWFANIYTPHSEEILSAVGFYAVNPDTQYSVFVLNDMDTDGQNSVGQLSGSMDWIHAAKGTLENIGYYTINLDKKIELEAEKRFAVIISVQTAGEIRPVAVEYGDEKNEIGVILSDGEGYVSADGINWESSEKKYNSNVCLKAYTKIAR